MNQPLRLRAALYIFALGLALAPRPAIAFVPEAERIEAAVAATNVAGGRGEALRLELSLRVDDRPAVATAELVTHPTGLARLELRGARGLVERHLLLGSEHSASRNGELFEEPRAFLPPLFVLQAANAATLRAALGSFGVRVDVIGIAPCDDADCFLIGDPDREVPRPELPPVRGLEQVPFDESLESLAPGAIELPELETRPEPPRVWIDMESYEVRGLDSAEGVQIRLGPVIAFEKLRFPSWLSIEEPGKSLLHFDVLRVSRVSAAASAFSRAWLLAPVIPDQGAGEAEPGTPSAPASAPAPRPRPGNPPTPPRSAP